MTTRRINGFWTGLAATALAAACGGTQTPAADTTDDQAVGDLGLGDVQGGDAKADGWGAALNCKPIPNVPALTSPYIVVSLDGLTLHLRDHASSYDRVFPIGPGAIDTSGLSKTPVGDFKTGPDTREVSDSGWGWYYPCKIWWTDEDTGQKKPVFAGLPFIRLQGPNPPAYALHGPVDNFTAPNGGSLRRGFVSHGCVRMQAADIVEVYARIKGRAGTPVRIQKDIERDSLGRAVDVPGRWIGQECETDADCGYTGGLCKKNPYGHGFCTAKCTTACPDKPGYATTKCVKDTSGGLCALSADVTNNRCANHYGMLARSVLLQGRTGSASVCQPGTPGRLGDPCLAATECTTARLCQPSGLAAGPGFCSQACTTTCPGSLICTALSGGSRCVETCKNQDQCSYGLACEDGVRRTAGGTYTACIPGN
jgi:hypothetical protein